MSAEVRVVVVILASCLTVFINACSNSPQPNTSNTLATQPEKGEKTRKGDKDNDQPKTANTDETSANVACDKALWDRVYNPDRLEVQAECKTVTGTITERNADDDGDEHMLLSLDNGQDGLINKRNEKKKDGDLVIEAVCVNPPTLKKVGDTCKGFSNAVNLPQLGDHVRVSGSYVLDGHNGWAEIHPITRIDKIK